METGFGGGVQVPKECAESVGVQGDGHALKVNQDGCQKGLIEKRLHLLYSTVTHKSK